MKANLIESVTSVMMGKPVVTGTRITVELILEKLAGGETVDEILEPHPRLTQEAVRAALAFASDGVTYAGAGSRQSWDNIKGTESRTEPGRTMASDQIAVTSGAA
jgi:uncharacterized protein (DUF433 family)